MFKKFLLRRKINRLIGQADRKPVFNNWDSLRSLLLLFETSEYDDADIFIEYLKRCGKQVNACGFIVKDDNYDYSQTPYRMILPKEDTDAFGILSEKIIDDLDTGAYDAIVDLTLKENLLMEYLLLRISAPLKIGLKKNNTPLYDFSISVTEETLGSDKSLTVAYLGKQILYYLKTIRTNHT